MKIIPAKFYLRSPLIVAPELLGKIVIRKLNQKIISGRIVEVEAYLSTNDEAAHGFKGINNRNQSLFKRGGHAYVHQIHAQNCLDIVAEDVGTPSGILIRALEPLEGIELMKKFRKKELLRELTSGPGKLSQALNITKALDGIDTTLSKSEINIIDDGYIISNIIKTKRIGISKSTEFDYRFYIANNPYISKK